MSDNENPKPYDAVLGDQNPVPEGAAVLGGIQGVKLRLNHQNPEVRIAGLYQALNYGEPGLDLVLKALEDESPQVQIKAHSLLIPLSEQKVKQALHEFNPYNLKLEAIETVTVNLCGEIIQRQEHLAKYFNQPVELVDWCSAAKFCAWLSKIIGKKYRLPSEAEWEYACRAGTTTPFHYGETITSELANYFAHTISYADEPKGESRGKTTPVGQFPPNAFGLYDMHGNVWEWCQDNWHENYRRAPKDGSSWNTKAWNFIFGSPFRRVVRSGSWFSLADWCRCTQRFSHDDEFELIPSLTNDRYYIKSNIGFRVVCEIF